MTRRINAVWAGLLALAVSSSPRAEEAVAPKAEAQNAETQKAETKKSEMPKLGLGIGVNLGNVFSGGSLAATPIALYVPINLSERFRVEPSFGYWYVGRGATVTALGASTASTGGYSIDGGLGGFYLLHPTPPFTVYLGARVGVVFVERSSEAATGIVTKVDQANMYVNPTLGLEWAVSRNFSVGGEAAPAFRFYFDPNVTVGGASATISSSKFGTGFEAVILMRLYL
jgi:hypothetical protein